MKRVGCLFPMVCMLASILVVLAQATDGQSSLLDDSYLELLSEDSNYAFVQVSQQLEGIAGLKQLTDVLDVVQGVELSEQLAGKDISVRYYTLALVELLSTMDENLCGLYRVRAKNQALTDWITLGSGAEFTLSELGSIDAGDMPVSYQEYCNVLTFDYGYKFYQEFLSFIVNQSQDSLLVSTANSLSEVLDSYYQEYFCSVDTLVSKESNSFLDGFVSHTSSDVGADVTSKLIVQELSEGAEISNLSELKTVLKLMVDIRNLLVVNLKQGEDADQIIALCCVDSCGDYCLQLLQEGYPDFVGTVNYQLNGESYGDWCSSAISINQKVYSKATKFAYGIALNFGDRNANALKDGLVTDMHSGTRETDNGYVVHYSVPQINVDSVDVDSIHAEIDEEYYQPCLTDEYRYDTSYEWYLNGDVLSVLGTFDFLDYRGYFAYNVDVVTGHCYDITEAAVLLGVSVEEYNSHLQQMIGTDVKNFIDWIASDLDDLSKSSEDEYNSHLQHCLSFETIENYGQFYFDESDNYIFFGELESLYDYQGFQFLNYDMETRDDYNHLYGIAGQLSGAEEWKQNLITKLEGLRDRSSTDSKNILYVDSMQEYGEVVNYYLSQEFGTGYPVVFIDCSVPGDYYGYKTVACYYNGSKFVFQSLIFGSLSYEAGSTVFFMECPDHHGGTDGVLYQFGNGTLSTLVGYGATNDIMVPGNVFYYWHGEEVSESEYCSNMYAYFNSHNLIGLGSNFEGSEQITVFDFTYTGNPSMDYEELYAAILKY